VRAREKAAGSSRSSKTRKGSVKYDEFKQEQQKVGGQLLASGTPILNPSEGFPAKIKKTDGTTSESPQIGKPRHMSLHDNNRVYKRVKTSLRLTFRPVSTETTAATDYLSGVADCVFLMLKWPVRVRVRVPATVSRHIMSSCLLPSAVMGNRQSRLPSNLLI
jgi:hypothetical protein